MRESSVWTYLKKGLLQEDPSIFLQRHEDMCASGIPDVSYLIAGVAGWIELKYIKEYPKKDGIIKVPHFSVFQKLWLTQYTRYGGTAWLFLRIEKDYFLFHGKSIANIGNSNRHELLINSTAYWLDRKMDFQQLISILSLRK